MKTKFAPLWVGLVLVSLALTGCQAIGSGPSGTKTEAFRVLAVESFLAEIAQNVAGERVTVESLIPRGVDPHTFEPAPQDVVRIAESDLIILNGAGFEAWAEQTLLNAGGERLVVEASAGLTAREMHTEAESAEDAAAGLEEEHQHGVDPHFWLDPVNVIRYVENIRDGLIAVDPPGQAVYTQNAEEYIAELKALDGWIQEQIAQIPMEKRMIVTNHESFGYFADRYGFEVIGAIIPSVTTGASPSAKQMAMLVDAIRATGASAIFLETGANPQLAEQVAQETGVKVAPELFTHSITDPGGIAPSYLAMMRYNVETIVNALK